MNEQVVPQGLKPLFTLLDKQGMNPRMCDTPVPFYDRRVRSVVQEVAPRVMQKRQWYAVYRALMDLRVWKGDAYAEFVQCVCDAVPEHEHLPSVPELRRMEVLSFARPVASWDSGRAPVTGVRFDAYLQIARATTEAWEA